MALHGGCDPLINLTACAGVHAGVDWHLHDNGGAAVVVLLLLLRLSNHASRVMQQAHA